MTALLGAVFRVLEIPAGLEAIPKFSLICFLGFLFDFLTSLEILKESLIVSYINLASLTLPALSNVSTTRSFCESSKLLALKIRLTYNSLEFNKLTSLSSLLTDS